MTKEQAWKEWVAPLATDSVGFEAFDTLYYKAFEAGWDAGLKSGESVCSMLRYEIESLEQKLRETKK
jgi:hypothetical protein